MRAKVLVFVAAVVLTGFTFSGGPEKKPEQESPDVLDKTNDRASNQHVEDPKYEGFWKKFFYRPQWVKTCRVKKIYVAVWKHTWGPVEVKDWVPVSKSPPGGQKSEQKPEAYFVRFPY